MVTPVRRTPRQRQARTLARPGRIYLILTRPVDAAGNVLPGPPEVGYIGQTRQQVWQRAEQHLTDQPFADLIVDVLLIDQGVWTDAQLDDREERWIRSGVQVDGRPVQRPRYNFVHNLENPDRIEIFRAVQHRQHREPGWTPPAQDAPRIPRQRGPVRPPSRRPGRWSARRRTVAGWAALWLLATAGMWWWGAGTWSGWEEPRNAAALGTCVWVALAYRFRRNIRRALRTRRRGRARR